MADLQSSFKNFISENHLLAPGSTVIAAVSGGVDSVVLLELLVTNGYLVEVAHVNFQLRGKEADDDEKFVAALAKKHGCPFHLKSFDTQNFAQENGLSIQMAARELRLEWFEQLAHERKAQAVALGTHLSDQTETMLINLVRGTGLAGLHGIPVHRKSLIRPLMFATREVILDFAQQRNIEFREDSSNASDKYWRNLIRHQAIPPLRTLRKDLEQSFDATAKRIRESEAIYREAVQARFKEVSHSKLGLIHISISALKQLENASTYLFEWLHPYGFNESDCSQILSSLEHQPGKKFLSNSHTLYLDRKDLILEENTNGEVKELQIERSTTSTSEPFQLSFHLEHGSQREVQPNRNQAFLNADRLQFPLTLRPWKAGDRFVPLGMKRMKKVSDFLIDQKVPLVLKNRTLVLTSGDEIAWLVGHRIDDRFKVDHTTENLYIVELLDR